MSRTWQRNDRYTALAKALSRYMRTGARVARGACRLDTAQFQAGLSRLLGKLGAWPDAAKAWYNRTRALDSAFLLLLGGIAAAGYVLRHEMWIIRGGLEPDYLAWANTHYFGGISGKYLVYARLILEGAWDELPINYPPGYPLFVAGMRAIGLELQEIRLVQGAMDALATLGIAFIALRLTGSRTLATVSAAAYALAPWLGLGAIYLLAEALLPAAVTGVLCLMLWTRSAPTPARWFVLGLAAACLPLLRPDMVLLIGPLIVWALLACPQNARIRGVTAVAGGYVLPLLAWGLFNLVQHDTFMLTSSARYYALWSGLGQVPSEYAYFVSDIRAAELLREHGLIYHSPEAEAFWADAYFNAWREHPDHVIRTILYRIKLIATQPDWVMFPHPAIWNSLFAHGWLVAIAAIGALLVHRRWAAAFLVAGPLVYALLSLGFVYVETRYVRYASLTYIFSAVIAMSAIAWCLALGSRGRARRFSAVLGTMGILGLMYFATPGEIQAAARQTVANLYASTALGNLAPDFQFSDLTFKPVFEETRLTPMPDGSAILVTTPGTWSYQLMAPLPGTGSRIIALRYDIELKEGGLGIGVLTGDGSRFLAQTSLPAKDGPTHYTGTLTAEIENNAQLVIYNFNPAETSTRALIRAIDGYEICGLEPDRALGDWSAWTPASTEGLHLCRLEPGQPDQ